MKLIFSLTLVLVHGSLPHLVSATIDVTLYGSVAITAVHMLYRTAPATFTVQCTAGVCGVLCCALHVHRVVQ